MEDVKYTDLNDNDLSVYIYLGILSQERTFLLKQKNGLMTDCKNTGYRLCEETYMSPFDYLNLINEVSHTYVKERVTENTITFFGTESGVRLHFHLTYN